MWPWGTRKPGSSGRSSARSTTHASPSAVVVSASARSSRTLPGSCTARLAPRHQRRRYRRVQPRLADGLRQQHPAGLRDHRSPIALHADRRVRPDTHVHLESASFLVADRTLDKSHRCRSAALSTYLIKDRTSPSRKPEASSRSRPGWRGFPCAWWRCRCALSRPPRRASLRARPEPAARRSPAESPGRSGRE
ncbi:MAG: hypothetical protein JWN52_4774 [Actinomycetia bacterium]|nr:hypothetical protein [Actinomycetes bacterium]